jgi:phosphate transport system protein
VLWVDCPVCSAEHWNALAAMQETRHQFRESLRELERETVEGLGMVLEQLNRALESVTEHDVELAGMVIADDERIDRRYVEMHQGILSLLALQAPVAGDLRIVAALLHIIRCLERMGDQCSNIAKLVRLSGDVAPKDEGILDTIERMGQVARSQLSQATEAFSTRNVKVAQNIVGLNGKMNRLNLEIFSRAVEAGDDLEVREWAMFMVLIARCLERIAGNTVDIAEQTVFVVTGLFREFAGEPQPA